MCLHYSCIDVCQTAGNETTLIDITSLKKGVMMKRFSWRQLYLPICLFILGSTCLIFLAFPQFPSPRSHFFLIPLGLFLLGAYDGLYVGIQIMKEAQAFGLRVHWYTQSKLLKGLASVLFIVWLIFQIVMTGTIQILSDWIFFAPALLLLAVSSYLFLKRRSGKF